jgi:hypothetical protein
LPTPTLDPAVERGAEQRPPDAAATAAAYLRGSAAPSVPGRISLNLPCLRPDQVAGAAGLAVHDGSLLQFPEGEAIRPVCCLGAIWSADGGLALLTDYGLNPQAGELALYDASADRLRTLLSGDLEITPLGLSPGGGWAVYLRMDRDPAPGQASAALMAVSADGRLILVGAAPPHGTRLYDRSGRLVSVLSTGGQAFRYGLEKVLWMPDGSAFFATLAEDHGLFRAEEQDGWQPMLADPSGAARSSLTLIQAPARPFRPACCWPDPDRQQACREACSERDYTRLQIGDWVMVSFDPPLASRLRLGPGLAGQVIDMLDPGTRAEITGGPVCADGYRWWRLVPEGAHLRGWAAEGDAWLVRFGSGR